MAGPRYAQRPDRNQPEIIDALEKVGALVLDLHLVGQGVPDILVGYRQCLFLLELKSERGKMEQSQIDFHEMWRSKGLPIFVVRSPLEALQAIGAVSG